MSTSRQLPHCEDCALRAPTVFSERMKSVSALKTRLRKKAKTTLGLFKIGDPRGRFFVRATGALYNTRGVIYAVTRKKFARDRARPA